MSGFVRRFASYPGNSVIQQIEGINIIDLPAPGNFQGTGTGVVALLGEFSDVTYGVAVDVNGNVTTSPKPVQILSSKDLLDKLGGFDETLGEFGKAGGSGFAALRNKKFASLICGVINNASSKGVRLVRDLPTCKLATDPSPIVPVQPGTVVAGREFKSGANRVRLAKLMTFSADLDIIRGTDGVVTNGAPAADLVFNSVLSNFLTCLRSDGSAGVKKGDALVMGALGDDRTLAIPVNATFTLGTGTLTTATYYYRVSALNAYGQTLASAETSLAITGPAGVNVNWGAVVGATSYKVYGRTTGGELLMATVSAPIVTWLDNGSVTPSGALPTVDTTGASAANANTYRVKSVTDLHNLVIEKQDGSLFALLTAAATVFRVHPGPSADSSVATAGASGLDLTGYTLPARPLDATIVAAAIPNPLAPTVVPVASSGTAWDPLSGLTLLVGPGVGTQDLIYTAAVQAPNAANNATLDALYGSAIDAFLLDGSPQNTVNVVYSARTSTNIRAKLRQHVIDASANGIGRMACISPELITTEAQAVADVDPGVAATRAERAVYCWPGLQSYIPEAVGVAVKGADGNTYLDGMLDDQSAGWIASIFSLLVPERNPGQAPSPVQDVMVNVAGFQRGISGLGLPDYILFKQRGICAPRFDPDIGWFVFQSGVTSSITKGQTEINRRRMADFIEDSLAAILAPFAKLPLSNATRDDEVGELDAFLEGLKSPNNPPAQRIIDYTIDDKSGNTPAQLAAGIFIVIARVQMIAMQNSIVVQVSVSPDAITVTAT